MMKDMRLSPTKRAHRDLVGGDIDRLQAGA